ncbi:LLM class flavin-dependent oxidoreductase [Mangrovihabitans endophyticus]|uniref:LLM class F420-dependent oxidoreductase n=1 Tax=Mangrovihabitans endophyticus TaxID=1751298 RepID=A0A8J3BWX1_9ACTN|nr:LLM class flavin-dependent oxidoreductase [Mangrovihabitans endophyticus]GGK86451.1 LLM class F420-dependent oxidoreductase [Mangrovihabitans endophyticus]
MVEFAYQAVPDSAATWRETARRAEAVGVHTLLVPDHPGSCAAPFVALAAAAAVTDTIRLGSYVCNAGVREPMLLAADVATLDVVSGGRALLGIGAGHTPAEWQAIGRSRPDVNGRVARCIAVAEATMRLLSGAEVTVDGPALTMAGARLTEPRPVQDRVPLLFGGGNTRLLEWAADHADIVGLSGLGRTLADGHRHTVRWRLDDVDAQVDRVRGRVLETLVQRFQITDDAEGALADMTEHTGLTAAQLRATPYVLVGTVDEIVSSIREHERRWGISRYAVRPPALDLLPTIMAGLSAA